MKPLHVVAFIAGLVFAIGLGLSGMTQPAKVMAFLDVTGSWDPSLACVMVGAIGVHAVMVRIAPPRPRFAPSYAFAKATGIDGALLAGAALFGLGWGVAGFCPGPAIVSATSLAPRTLAFVAAMAVGMGGYGFVERMRAGALKRTDSGVASAGE